MDEINPTTVLSGREFQKHRTAGVYAWKRGDQYLYVGMSTLPMSRILTHNIIGCKEDVLDTDTIEIYGGFPRIADARILEQQLIRRYTPKYNTAGIQLKQNAIFVRRGLLR